MTYIDESGCIACGACTAFCRNDCIKYLPMKDVYRIDSSDCTNCGECIEICPTQTIHGQRRMISRKHYIEESECIACGACADSCPAYCIEYIEDKDVFRIDTDRCPGCFICDCPFGAIKPC